MSYGLFNGNDRLIRIPAAVSVPTLVFTLIVTQLITSSHPDFFLAEIRFSGARRAIGAR